MGGVGKPPTGWENETSPADALRSRPLARSVRGAQIRIPLRAMPVPSGCPVVVPKRRADCEASPRLAHHLPRSSPVPTDHPTSPSQARLISSDDAPAVALTWRRHRPSHPLPTRTSPLPLPLPGASRPTLHQHHLRKIEPSATSTAVRASPVQLAYQGQRGDTTHLDPFHVLMPCKSSCAVYCIQWNTSKKAVGIPPRLISFVPALCDWRWLGSCPPYAGF